MENSKVSPQKVQPTSNKRTGLVLLTVALAFFAGIVLKTVFLK
ncbi:MAG: cytochrome oxidase small assembly protein [Burkholderiales bacterium]|nr:cytochrome oxidase small assembly protein [Burkholderiales bacterium]